MVIKIRCPWCDELTTYDPKNDIYTCACGTVIYLPTGAALSDPYKEWIRAYKEDTARKRTGTSGNRRSNKRKPPSPKRQWCAMYGDS